MNFLLDRNSVFRNRPRDRKGGKRFVVVLAVIVFLYIAGSWLAAELRPLALRSSNPALKLVAQLSEATDFKFFQTKQSLIIENRALEDQLDDQVLLVLRLQALEQENRELQSLLGRSPEDRLVIAAKILTKPDRSPYDVLIIDVGTSTAKVAVGNKVGLGEVVLGEVVDVSGRSARVRLYSSPGVLLPVMIGPHSLQAEASGVGGGNFNISLPRGAEISIGDRVTSSVAPGLLLGSVGAIDDTPNKPFSTVIFRSPINWFEQTWIQVYGD